MADDRQFLDIDGAGLPYDVDAEQAVIGSILIDPSCINEVITQIKDEYFYIPQHREIYKILVDMTNDNLRIDFVTILDKLKKEGVYEKAGGKSYLTELVQSVPSSANVLTYVSIVRERYYARALIVASRQIITDATENTMDAGKLLDTAEQRIYNIREGRSVSGLEHIKSVIENETYERLSKMNNPEPKDNYVGIPTGISGLDKMITGLNKSDLIILGARPGMGKTSFALNIVRNVAVQAGKTVAFFSLEMTRDQLAQRMLSGDAAIKSEKLRTGQLEPDEWTRLGQAAAVLSIFTALTFAASLIMCHFEPYSLTDILFEAVSAAGTVGLTKGITPLLSPISHIILIILMFAGRVGGITLMLTLARQKNDALSTRPVEKILIG